MNEHRIISIRHLTPSAYVVRFERNGLAFIPGQSICVGIASDLDRPYSIYSGINDDYLEILVKEVESGNLSRKLKLISPGLPLYVDVPRGHFTIQSEIETDRPLILIATGTGIAPFHSFIRSYEKISYQIIHGVKYNFEAYDKEDYKNENYIVCTSRDTLGTFSGRVSEFLKPREYNQDVLFCLCGNYEMIDDVQTSLLSKGVRPDKIKTEGYF